MPDHRFFERQGPFTIEQIATATESTIAGTPANTSVSIQDVAALDVATPETISFIDNPKYRDAFYATKAGACFMRPDMAANAPAGLMCLVSKNPYKSYALAAQLFYPTGKPTPGISSTATVDPSATIGDGVRIDPHVVIGAGVVIGDYTWIEAGAVIGDHVEIGAGCRIGIHASVSHAIIGKNVRLYPGTRIGQDGFGFAIDPKGFVKVPQLGRVIIQDFCEVGANTCIDRGAGPDTVIGMGTWIDNLVQIGHNVKIGKGCIIVAQVGIAGSTVVEDYVAIGGQAGVAGHLHIGKGVQIAAGSGVISNIEPGVTVMGYPALPKTQFMRNISFLNRATRRKSNTTEAE